MNNHYIIVIVLVSFLFSFEKIDINNSNIDQLKKLPLSNEKIILIHNYLNNYGEIQSIYNLMNIKQLNSSDLELLKESVVVKSINKLKPHVELFNNYNEDPKLYLDDDKYESLIINDNNYNYNAKRLLSYNSTPHESGSEYHVDYFF